MIVRWADGRTWLLPRRNRCACYGVRPHEGWPVYDWFVDRRGEKCCSRCGLELRVWHHAVEVQHGTQDQQAAARGAALG